MLDLKHFAHLTASDIVETSPNGWEVLEANLSAETAILCYNPDGLDDCNSEGSFPSENKVEVESQNLCDIM